MASLNDTPGALERASLLAHLDRLSSPVLEAARTGRLAVSLHRGPNPDTHRYAPLEALGRLLCGLAPLVELQLAEPSHDTGAKSGPAGVIEALHRVFDDPAGSGLVFDGGTQPLVDSAFLALAFLRAPRLWDALPNDIQHRVLTELRRTRKIRPHWNNWLLFSATVEAFFARFGEPWDEMRVDYAVRQHDQWHVGDGQYADGPLYHVDYYNSFVIQPLLLEVLEAVGGAISPWKTYRERMIVRAHRTAQVLERLVAPDGSFPPLGRSITYRCASMHLLALLAWRSQLPSSLGPGQVRGALAVKLQ